MVFGIIANKRTNKMRILLAIGMLCDLAGFLLVLTGADILPVGEMSGQMIWIIVGVALMLIGSVCMLLGLKGLVNRNG